jgi:hypothetical protein
MACDVGIWAYRWLLSAARAAFAYNLGACIAIRGDLRGVTASCAPVGSVGGGASGGAGVAVGVTMGSLVGGMLFRVCR